MPIRYNKIVWHRFSLGKRSQNIHLKNARLASQNVQDNKNYNEDLFGFKG